MTHIIPLEQKQFAEIHLRIQKEFLDELGKGEDPVQKGIAKGTLEAFPSAREALLETLKGNQIISDDVEHIDPEDFVVSNYGLTMNDLLEFIQRVTRQTFAAFCAAKGSPEEKYKTAITSLFTEETIQNLEYYLGKKGAKGETDLKIAIVLFIGHLNYLDAIFSQENKEIQEKNGMLPNPE